MTEQTPEQVPPPVDDAPDDAAPALDDTGNADEQVGEYVDDDELDDDDDDGADRPVAGAGEPLA